MKYQTLDLRRFFRNRFETFVDHDDASGSHVNDGVPLTLGNVCKLLEDDIEPFPRNYDQDFRKVCGHEYLIWLRESRTYGDVARLLAYRLNAFEHGVLRPNGRWVSALLRGEEIPPSNMDMPASRLSGTATI
ncbi:hypothetical protein F9L00_16855 [Brucella anthropi]|uniref:hypothetical protein n=1 Tax=Brucella/Ochrobactrum group TaxID=2826938 RepID=UPI00124C0255|nr:MULTISPECIES: hypothetical protein [Brucella/Ochrobactrum group]KAB2759536.1 hypothetical protein F9K98_21070 [Brucella anthropi]KAB2775337.1 hypothetical protein F9L00_16855 [Brucella anthropi]MCQ9146901.1 hypothetical protein [Ochrobactrum sp. BTU2]UGQ20864.1 hypothetical protein LRL11_12350 [Brucella anthropi]